MKAKIILNLTVSLDGFIADEKGGYEWIVPSGNHAMNTKAVWSHARFLERVSTVIMGKRSYDQGLHAEYVGKQVYVITSQELEDCGNIHFRGGEIVRIITRLRDAAEGDIYLFGGGITIDPILKAGLIDEYIIGIIPMILGKGIPLFLPDNPAIPLQLTHSYVEDGVVILRYVPRDGVRKVE